MSTVARLHDATNRLIERNLNTALDAVVALAREGASVLEVEVSDRQPVIWLATPVPDGLAGDAGLVRRHASGGWQEYVRVIRYAHCQVQWRERQPLPRPPSRPLSTLRNHP